MLQNAIGLNSGVYLYRLQAVDHVQTKKNDFNEMMDHFIRDFCPGWTSLYRDERIFYSSPGPFSNEIEKGRLVMYLNS
jgi:hypothetical protein